MAAPVMESHPGFIEEIDASEMELKDVSICNTNDDNGISHLRCQFLFL